MEKPCFLLKCRTLQDGKSAVGDPIVVGENYYVIHPEKGICYGRLMLIRWEDSVTIVKVVTHTTPEYEGEPFIATPHSDQTVELYDSSEAAEQRRKEEAKETS